MNEEPKYTLRLTQEERLEIAVALSYYRDLCARHERFRRVLETLDALLDKTRTLLPDYMVEHLRGMEALFSGASSEDVSEVLKIQKEGGE